MEKIFDSRVEQSEYPVSSMPDFSNLANCTKEALNAIRDKDRGPDDPTKFNDLLERIAGAESELPPVYRENVSQPFVQKLEWYGNNTFKYMLNRDKAREGRAGLLLDIAQAILQNGEGYLTRELDAFQEVICDLYDGFLSNEDRHDVKLPDLSVISPLVKWGRPNFGPYTWTADDTINMGIHTAIVSMPPTNASKGLLAWGALGHETAGHDILHADDGLHDELKAAVWEALSKEQINPILPDQWADRLDESASDVLGILNMGPAVGISLIGYFRAMNASMGGPMKLWNISLHIDYDCHPADILRGYLAASVIRRLGFDNAKAWGDAIEAEVNKDLTEIRLNVLPKMDGTLDPKSGTVISPADGRKSADVVAETVMNYRLDSLEGHALSEIQNWRNIDEETVMVLRSALKSSNLEDVDLLEGFYAAHVVDAAIREALVNGSDVQLVFSNMITILKAMHDDNPVWGPMYVEHPGDIVRLRPVVSRRRRFAWTK
jgi:hypothetical protein